jgi:hypothetical protein
MSDLDKILLTSSLTVVVGVFVFVLGQVFLKFFIEPIHEQKKLIGEIADALIYYGSTYGNPERGVSERGNQAQERLRQLSTLLLSRTGLIPCYGCFASMRLVRQVSEIGIAAQGLMGISNNINLAPDADANGAVLTNIRWRDGIKEALGLRF